MHICLIILSRAPDMRHGTFALEESEKAGGQTRDRTRAQESSVRSNAGAMPPQKIFFPDSNTLATNIIFKPFF